MKNVKVGMQLAIGILLLLITGIGIWRLGAASGEADFMLREAMHKPEQEDNRNGLARSRKEIADRLHSFEQRKKEVLEQQLSAAATEKREAYIGARNAVYRAKENGNLSEAKRLIDAGMKPALEAYVLSMNNVLDYQKQQIDQSALAIENNFRHGSLLLIAISAATIFLGFVMATRISRRLARQLGGEPQCTGTSPQISNGDVNLSTRTEQAAG